MASHDYNIANASGAAVRSDINSALSAIVSRNSGASAPGTTFAYQTWVDTTSGTIKHRNAANSGWLVDSTADETYVLSRSSNTLLDVSDIGKMIVATSTFSQTFDAAATLGDGWNVRYRNDGSGVITLDPNGTETIDGTTTLDLFPGDSCTIFCNGSAFKTVGLKRQVVKRKTADESVTSSTALQDDDHLSYSVAANEEWVSSFFIDMGSAIATTGLKLAVNVPSGATTNISFSISPDGATPQGGRTTTSGFTFTFGAAAIGGATAVLTIHVWVLNGATPGAVQLQWAQGASSGTALTFRKGSYLTATKVG